MKLPHFFALSGFALVGFPFGLWEVRVLSFDENYLLLALFVLAILVVLLRSTRVRRGRDARPDRGWLGDSGDSGDGGGD
ncbi:MAG: hypothetical protein AAGC92_13480 [Pseudomonadota bacterium]